MKKLLSIFLLSLLFFAVGQKALADNNYISTSPAVLNVQYALPYPGILPDNPLYLLKALRDNIGNLLITDPLKKSDYELLLADKRLGAANALIAKNNVDLAITTLSKAENYFELAVQQAALAKSQGENTDEILGRLLTASEKHQLVIYKMGQQVKGDARQVLGVSQQRALNFQKSVEQLMSK